MGSRYYIYDSYTDTVAEFAKTTSSTVPKETANKLATMVNRARGSYGRAVNAAMTTVGGVYDKPNLLGQAVGRGKAVWKSGKVGKAGIIGAGLAAASGAGYGGYRLATRGKRRADRKQAERNSVRGRVRRLLGR